jgi:hypothetical protein
VLGLMQLATSASASFCSSGGTNYYSYGPHGSELFLVKDILDLGSAICRANFRCMHISFEPIDAKGC